MLYRIILFSCFINLAAIALERKCPVVVSQTSKVQMPGWLRGGGGGGDVEVSILSVHYCDDL